MGEVPIGTADQPRGRTLKPLVAIAVVMLVVISLYFVVRSLPLEMLGEIRPRRFTWWSLPLIAVLQIVFLLAGAEIWRRVVRVLTGKQCTLWESYLQLAVVSVGKYVPGKVWGFVARAGEMYRQQIPVHLSLVSSVVEQLLLITGALLVAIVAALIALPQYVVEIVVGGVLLLLAAMMLSTKIPVLARWVVQRRNVQSAPDPVHHLDAKSVLGFTLAYAVLWILSGLIFSMIYFSLFDAPVSTEGVAALTLANTVGIVLGFFAFFIPGGIGVREAVATGVLAGFVPVREALLAAVSYRAWMILIDGLNAVLILGREARLARPTATDEPGESRQ